VPGTALAGSSTPMLAGSSTMAPGVHHLPSRVDMTPRPTSPRESLARDFGGPRQITVVNPAPSSGKTAAVNALHAIFRQVRSDVVAWDSHGLSGVEFGRERDRLARMYKVLIVDTSDAAGPALDATDQLVVAVDSRLDSVRAAEAMLAELETSGQAALALNAVVIISTTSKPDGNHGAATAQRFAARTRAVFVGTDAWDRIAQAVADGL
jgi:hypothetical protein